MANAHPRRRIAALYLIYMHTPAEELTSPLLIPHDDTTDGPGRAKLPHLRATTRTIELALVGEADGMVRGGCELVRNAALWAAYWKGLNSIDALF